jgi:hypothetical protein
VANYNANINLNIVGATRLNAVIASVGKLNNLAQNLKPINLLSPGAGNLGNKLRQALKPITDFARDVENGNKRISNTFEGASQQASTFRTVLNNVKVAAGGYDKQVASVKLYANALAEAEKQANKLSRAQLDLVRTAKGLQTQNIRDAEIIGRRARVTKGRAAQARTREAASNAIIGGAFPLLFGQGAGAALGGGLGGAAGGLVGGQFGFGLSLVGTAIGQTFDNASNSAKDFSDALSDTGDATAALETALGRLDKETKTQISNLAQSGQQAAAAEASFDALARKIGIEQAEAFQRAGKATGEWGSALQTWLTKTYANVVLLGEAFDRTFRSLPGLQQPTSVFDIVEAVPQQQLSQEAQGRIEDLAGQNILLEKQVALSQLTTDASIDQRLQLERQVALQEYVNSAVALERQLKQKLLSDQEYNLRLKTAELNLTRELYTLENAAQQERERKAKEAQQAAEQAARKQEQTFKNILGLQAELLQTSLQAADVDVEVARIREGQAVALQEEANQLNTRFNIEARILQLQLDQKLTSSEISAQERALLESVYRQQLANLEAQYITRQQSISQAQALLQLNKFIADEAAKQQTLQPFEDLRKNRELEIQYSRAYLRLVTEGVLPAEAERIANFERLVAEQLNALNQQIATTNAALLQAEAYGASADKVKELRDELERLQNARGAVSAQAAQGPGEGSTDAQRAADAIAQVRGELNQLGDPINAAVAGANAIGNAFSQSFQGLVTGTQTAQEALSNFFKSIGEAFVSMAAEIIAKQLVMITLQTILKALGFVGGGGNGGGGDPLKGVGGADWTKYIKPAADGAYWPGGFEAFADGGLVTKPTMGLIGEGGEPEYVIPQSKMSAAMSRYSRGARGESVIPGNGGDTESAGGTAVATAPIDVRYTVERINSVDYVTADQFQRGMQQAAAQGAKQGQQLTLRQLQQSTTTRRRLGI